MSELPKYLQNETERSKSRKQEKRIVKKGFVTIASGAIWSQKGDVQLEDYLIEAKRTNKKSMAIKEEWLEKIYREATAIGKDAGVELEIGNYYIQGVVHRKKL